MKKTLKNLVMATLMSGAIAVSNPTYSQYPETQKQETPKEQKLSPHLNFYFETGEYLKYENLPEFKKYVKAWLCDCPKDKNIGAIFFNYGDTNEDGFYDYVVVEKSSDQIRSQESFYFNLDTKKIDYVLDIYEFCWRKITDCDRIISKSYDEIDQKESYQIGEDFNERIRKFSSVQKEFSRFNPESLEKLVREEFDSKLNLVDGKLVGNSKIPIEKFLSEKEIKEVEDYIKGKPERERLKREEIERLKVEYENREKIRIEQEEKIKAEKEAKKITAKLGINGGVAINNQGLYESSDLKIDYIKGKGSTTGSFLGITPKLTNKKGKGFAMGLDLFMMNSKKMYSEFATSGNKKSWGDGNYKLIKNYTSTNYVSVKNTNLFGFKIGYVSPVCEIFANAGFLRQKQVETTTVTIEEYEEVNGVQQGQSSFKTEYHDWESKRFFGPFYFGLGIDFFPSFKEKNSNKNLSFSIDGLIANKNYVYIPFGGEVNSSKLKIIKAGLKYTFKK